MYKMEKFSNLTVRAIVNMYKYVLSHPVPGLRIWMDENDISIWYALIFDIPSADGAFDGGEYLIKFTIKETFPHSPPSAEFLTPNGIYSLGGRFCVSIGEFHSQNYRPDIGIDGYALAVKGSFMDRTIFADHGGIRIELRDLNICKEMAVNSREYNKTYYGNIIENMNALSVAKPAEVSAKPLTLRERMALKKQAQSIV